MATHPITNIITTHRPPLSPYEDLYKHFHSNPELSFCEHSTASRVAQEIPPDYSVKTNIGGTGLAAILRNGDGPTVLLRADMDALPVEEKTGLPYASTKRMQNVDGEEHPVMHACGHDMHMTSSLAASKLLADAKAAWAGTLVLIFQPAEEKGAGAQAMVDDGLYDPKKHDVPIPDICLGAHVMPFRSGVIGTRAGAFMSAGDSMKITLHGRGSHGSMPHRSIDPVIMAAYATTRLQTLVSREVDPAETAVVSVASIQAGQTENVIPAVATMKLTARTFNEETRSHVLSGIRRIVKAEMDASDAGSDPVIEPIADYPVTSNDAEAVPKVQETFAAHFGDSHWKDFPALLASEDFSILGTSIKKPCVFWAYGGVDPELWDQKEREGKLKSDIPANHSAFFAPCIQPTLTRAVDGYAAAALTWLAKK